MTVTMTMIMTGKIRYNAPPLNGSKRVVHDINNFEFPNSRIMNIFTLFLGLGERMLEEEVEFLI